MNATRRAAATGTSIILLLILASSESDASFTDRASDGSVVSATSLAPGTAPSAAPGGGALPSVQFSWTVPAGSFATHWSVMRKSGGCAGWNPASEDAIGTAPAGSYTDGAVSIGSSYCYSARAVFQEWTSAATPLEPGAAVSFEQRELFLDHATKQLVAAAGTGAHAFVCLVQVLGVCLTPGPQAAVWSSEASWPVASASGWSLRVEVTAFAVLVLGAVTFDVTAWYEASGACSAPAASTRIASGVLPVSATGIATANLVANPAFSPPSSPSKVCLRIEMGSSLLAVISNITFASGTSTFLRGVMP